MTGVVEERRARATGTLVQLYDRGEDDFERRDDGANWDRWETICVEHGGVSALIFLGRAATWEGALALLPD